MNYGSTIMATDWSSPDWRDKLLKKTLFFIPAANPHAEPQFPKVKKWLLEVDDDGTPLREVGLDAEGSPIFRMLDGDDYGFWSDSNVSFTKENLTLIAAAEFEDAWRKAKKADPVGTDHDRAAPSRF
ncbi:MAG: hypothetical protein H7A44_12050 [Opitutaceae bacterium]|nr:hypothetical protein [Opitutaceae bacterium]